MNILLIDANYITSDHGYNSTPLGLLRIGAVAEQCGYTPDIIWNDLSNKPRRLRVDVDSAIDVLDGRLHPQKYDLIGFNTRCDNLPIVIEVVDRIKRKNCNVISVLGGPGVSFADRDIMSAYDSIDVIVRGEGEEIFADLLLSLNNGNDLSDIAGVTYRTSNGSIMKNDDRIPSRNLDSLPDPAYHLILDSLRIADVKTISIEAGRGCPNKCTFCSTHRFWGTHVRMRSPSKIVQDMELLHGELGIARFALTHDNLLCNSDFITSFCQIVHNRLPNVSWKMCASLNLLTEDNIRMVAEAGCIEIFIGIETTSVQMSTHIARKFSSIKKITEIMDILKCYKIKAVMSHIIGFPNETVSDIDRTIQSAIYQKSRYPFGSGKCALQFHPLTIFPGTKLYDEFRDKLIYCHNFGSMGADIEKSSYCLSKVKEHPAIFSAYACYDSLKQQRNILICNVLKYIANMFPRMITLLLTKLGIGYYELHELFRNHLKERGLDISHFDCPIYCSDEADLLYCDEFVNFIDNTYHKYRLSNPYYKLILEFEAKVLQRRHRVLNELTFLNIEEFIRESKRILVPNSTQIIKYEMDPEIAYQRAYNVNDEAPLDGNITYFCYYQPRHSPMRSYLRISEDAKIVISEIIKTIDGFLSAFDISDNICSRLSIYDNPKIIRRNILAQITSFLKAGVLLFSEEIENS